MLITRHAVVRLCISAGSYFLLHCPDGICHFWRVYFNFIPVNTASPLQDPSQPAASGQQPVLSTTSSGTLSLGVGSLSPGSALPDVYTCKGASESPQVSWSGIPAGTKSLVLILEDPDAPTGVFTHWLVYNIPPRIRGVAQGQPNAKVLSNEAQQGESSTGQRGYYPPCPPPGSTHRYIFHLYALD